MNPYTEARSRKLLHAAMLSLLAVLGVVLWTAAPAHATFPGANGKIIYTHSLDDSFTRFEVINPDGSGQAPLTQACCYDRDPAWSPDGSKIAFETDRYGARFDIVVMNADGTGLTRLTTNPGDDNQPAWSPDGQKIAFSRQVLGDPSADIYTINADGTGLTAVTDNERLTHDFAPAWSPDGQRIAFERFVYVIFEPGNQILFSNIYVMNADGSSQTNLTNLSQDASFAGLPNWSPDGSKIVFSLASLPARTSRIWTMNADGTGQAQLTSIVSDRGDPTWSPDGTKIAFHGCANNCGIYTMNPDGSGLSLLGANSANPDLDWQPLPFKNASKKCSAHPGDYRNHGQCVKANR